MANEKRLINAVRYGEVLERYINAPHVKVFGKYSDGMQLAINTCIELLNAQRTVDAVEVIRCKDCKHWIHIENGMGDCTNRRFHLDGHADPTMEMDGFCSCGERKEGE